MKDNIIDMDISLAILPPVDLLPTTDDRCSVKTPYGEVFGRLTDSLMWLEPASSRALIYAAKELQLSSIVEIILLYPVNRLLAPGDIFFPSDVIDLTQGQSPTFFVGKGYGFLPQNPPFCPTLRSALFDAAYRVTADMPLQDRPAIFRRGTFAAMEKQTFDTLDADMFLMWAYDAFGFTGVPTSFLARELELCYAPLGYVVSHKQRDEHSDGLVGNALATASDILFSLLKIVHSHIPHVHSCSCAKAMQSVRERGLVSDDWHTWLNVGC
jgi:5'-methylthioadenosine phosphorylase